MKPHSYIHHMLDEVLAAYVREHPGGLAHSVGDLMKWSASKLDAGTEAPFAAVVIWQDGPQEPLRIRAENPRGISPTSPVGDMLGALMDLARARS